MSTPSLSRYLRAIAVAGIIAASAIVSSGTASAAKDEIVWAEASVDGVTVVVDGSELPVNTSVQASSYWCPRC